MSVKNAPTRNVDVGASKAAKVILGRFDRQLIKPAAVLVRLSGWAIIAFVYYLAIFGDITDIERRNVYVWILIYSLYMVSLEVIRYIWSSEIYETTWFRGIRILVNIILISVVVSIAPTQRYLLFLCFSVPIFACIVYAAETQWIKLTVYLLCVLGIYFGDVIFSYQPRLDLRSLLVYSIILAGFGVCSEIFRKQVYSASNGLTTIVRDLYKTLDLQKLIEAILLNAIELTFAEYGFILVVNPRTNRYVWHFAYNLELRPESSVDNLVKECIVDARRPLDENRPTVPLFNDKKIYSEYFRNLPKSTTAEFLYNGAGQLLGVISVARDDLQGFDKISRNLLKEFSFLICNAIENCFEYRALKLREARSRGAGEKFVSAGGENKVINILFEEVRHQIPHAEKLTVHEYQPQDGALLPLLSDSVENTPNLYLWSNQRARKVEPHLHMGYGIAGHALQLKDTILVPDVSVHPWFVEISHTPSISSLLVAPLYAQNGEDYYGTISLESSKPFAFDLEDEAMLTSLVTQASQAITKVRDFQAWREQGDTLRKILEQIGKFNISGPELDLCQEIVEAATALLGFGIARIRLLLKEDSLVTTGVAGVSPQIKARLLNKDIPYAKLSPFLDPDIKAGNTYVIRAETEGWKQFVDEYLEKPSLVHTSKNGWNIYDALVTPLMTQSGVLIGILTLDQPLSGFVPNRQILELIGVFANAASWVIELSRSQRYLAEQRYRAQSFIDTISQELVKGRDKNALCEVVVQVGAKLLSAEGCSLYFVRGKNIELTHSSYLAKADYINRSKPISDLPNAGLTAWVAATGQVLRFNNEEYKEHVAWAGEEQHLKHLPSKCCHSLLIAPVKDKDESVIGVMTLENKKTLLGLKDFDDDDQIRLISLTYEFAKAVEIIGFYNDMKEWEYSGLADDLHDIMNLYHSGVALGIETLEAWWAQGNMEKVNELIPTIRKHAFTTVFELNELHTNLLRNSLESGSFREAMQKILLEWSTRVSPKYIEAMQIELSCPDDIAIPTGLKATIIRITSLAFSNALQHSGIIDNSDIRILIKVEQKDQQVTLSIFDNGRGIDLEKTPEGFGMKRMKDLSKKINDWGNVSANLNIKTELSKGTEVLLTLTMASAIV